MISMGKVIDDRRHPWLSSSERIDLDPTNATNRDRGVSAVDAFASMGDVVDVVVALDHRLGVPQNSNENKSLVFAARLIAW